MHIHKSSCQKNSSSHETTDDSCFHRKVVCRWPRTEREKRSESKTTQAFIFNLADLFLRQHFMALMLRALILLNRARKSLFIVEFILQLNGQHRFQSLGLRLDTEMNAKSLVLIQSIENNFLSRRKSKKSIVEVQLSSR